MKLATAIVVLLMAANGNARAQPAQPAQPTVTETGVKRLRDFSFAPFATVRLGKYAALGGSVDENRSTSEYGNGPTIFFLSAGARVHDVTIAFVFGFGGAGVSDETRAILTDANAEPSGSYFTAVVGLETEYRFRHVSSRFVPFAGGMIGFGTMGHGGDFSERDRINIGHSGLHLRGTAGVDALTTGWFGLGLVAELGMTMYGSPTATYTTEDDVTTLDDEYTTYDEMLDANGGTGLYAGLAIRAVFFP